MERKTALYERIIKEYLKYLIGKDGMLPDSEKADCLWVFDKRLAAFGYLIGKDGTSPDS